ncbi:Type 1 glutamine amidotransferase-like domain-containing protein [Allobranchiibius huperziae]|uniref:Dipeptidase E n=1 Tax=Allobranchiibius huperziae TaxID=1874116 RepID=A0A853DPZ0_9MICO|nr:Type 1 glutamine amidotransferase-like domain-containing protein [Allobranchiibius huperziae]NYJ76185.1 dipeptidase E [Allobranchiibius huperziae]
MKLLLTSCGITNASLRNALVDLLGKPISECSALLIPTAAYSFPDGPDLALRLIDGTATSPLSGLGWKSLGVLELSVLPTVRLENWVPRLRETDALLVGGGDPMFLCRWMRRSGLADLLPSLDSVYVGVSGGSVAVGAVGDDYDGRDEPVGVAEAIGLVQFAIYPHLDHPDMPDAALAEIERWAGRLSSPTYAIDDQTAIRVVDGEVDVISEGRWELVGA